MDDLGITGWLSAVYKFGLSVFVSNRRQNAWTDRAQFFCGTWRGPLEDKEVGRCRKLWSEIMK